MQFGELTDSQITAFQDAQRYTVRTPSFVVWIEGFECASGYVMDMDIDIGIESQRGRGYLNIGRAILSMCNEKGVFYSDGRSAIRDAARIKIWAGFDGLNIPVFTGEVQRVKPSSANDIVTLDCVDLMRRFREMTISGSTFPNNTPELIMKYFCEMVDCRETEISLSSETSGVCNDPTFSEQSVLSALEKVCNSIFYSAYFDESGRFKASEREHRNRVDFVFGSDNVSDCTRLADTEIVNDISIEYLPGFFLRAYDQASIDEYGRRSRTDRVYLLNSVLVSNIIQGSIDHELQYEYEALKLTSSVDSSHIDCIHIKMRGSDAQGTVTASIYTDNSGVPGTLLATSSPRTGVELPSDFAWVVFRFDGAIDISAETDYWIVIDTSSVDNGSVYVQSRYVEAPGRRAYFSETWHTVDNEEMLHIIRGSVQARRLAADIIRFYRTPHERLRIVAPGIPQLQVQDEVFVDIPEKGIEGSYVVERCRHVIGPGEYTTIHTLRKS